MGKFFWMFQGPQFLDVRGWKLEPNTEWGGRVPSIHGFIPVDEDFPLEGDAEKAMAMLDESIFESIQTDVQTENKTTVRKLLKTWETGIGSRTKGYTLSCQVFTEYI